MYLSLTRLLAADGVVS